LLNPPPPNKIPGYATVHHHIPTNAHNALTGIKGVCSSRHIHYFCQQVISFPVIFRSSFLVNRTCHRLAHILWACGWAQQCARATQTHSTSFSLWPRSLATLTGDRYYVTQLQHDIKVVTEQCFAWFTVRVPRRAGPLAQAPAPQYSVAGADIYDDHYVRGGWPAALPRLYSDIGQWFMQIRAVSSIDHWRTVWNIITQQVQ